MSCNDITVIKNEQPIMLSQATDAIEVLIDGNIIELSQASDDINVIQTLEVIYVCAQNPIANFIPFFFIAIQDQTTFTLPAVALSCQLCAINGTSQSQAKTPTPDFVITENILTLSQGVDEGDTVFGVIQIS